MWGALNAAGITFRLSGYRAMFGKDLVPIEEGKDIQIPGVNVVLPSNLPLSFVTGVGWDQRTEKRTAFDGTKVTRGASSLALEDASIFLTGPMGPHFSAFVEFPMYETKAWEFTPTGPSGPGSDRRFPGGANEPFGNLGPTGNFQFVNENPVFEVAKFWWNNLLGDSLPRDSFNALVGITHMPLPYASGKVRLSVNQYLIYERRAVDLISPVHPSLMGADELFRLGEPQILAEFNGMIVPGKPVTATASRDTLWFEYHLGVTNGSNGATDNNKAKDVYGRLVARYYMSSLGVFGFHSPDTYGSNNRMDPAFQIGNNGVVGGGCVGTWAPGCGGIYSTPGTPGFNNRNASTAVGVDGTLNLTPFINIPISIDNQYMWRNETNPTGFNVELKWRGGFHQVNWFVTPQLVAYGRYDWIKGKPFDDTVAGGITFSHPSEHDIVAGIQYAVFENVKLIGEARHHIFKDTATTGFVVNPLTQPFAVRTTPAKLVDDGFTARLMMGF
jgi:hypothetical protein